MKLGMYRKPDGQVELKNLIKLLFTNIFSLYYASHLINCQISSRNHIFDLIFFQNIMAQLANNQQLASLLEMGCDQNLCKAAILNTKSQNLDVLLDWISDQSGQQEKWKTWLQERSNSPQKVQQNSNMQSISHLVNQEYVAQLVSLGFSKNVSQKSLLLTNNASLESAQAWIDKHKYDADFEEELFLEGQAYQESTMTDQEARAKLKQLTQRARQIRTKREEEEAREREKNRVRFGKQMVQAKRIAEEQAMKRQVELDKIQKRKDEEYKAKLLQDMKREKNAKLGRKTDEPLKKKEEEKPKLNFLEQFELQCQQVHIGMMAHPHKAKAFFETAAKILSNIIKNNGEEKYRKINLSNAKIQELIVSCFGGVEALKVTGFQEENGFLVMHNWDAHRLNQAIEIINRYLNQY